MQKIIAIVGPTASGKTSLAIELATKFNGEIISADSRAIYRGLDIGTAKPTPEERRRVKHHLLDVANVGERFTVVQFQQLANTAMRDISRRGKIPILVGGTGLYIDAVLKGYQFPPEGDPELRYHLELEPDERLREILQAIDPASFSTIDLNNRRRVVRAVEVALTSGKSFVHQRIAMKPHYQALMIGIWRSKKELKERFDERFEEWMKSGLIKEVRWALDETSPDWVASLGLQYRYFAQYLQGEISLISAIEQTKKSNYAFIKRQMTWFKRDKNIRWIDTKRQAIELIEQFLKT